MKPETTKRLHDVHAAREELQRYSTGRTREDLRSDRTFQLVVERWLEIAVEALRQAERSNPAIIERLSGVRNIVGTRNRLIHGYDDINYSLVRDIVDIHAPALKTEINALLREAPDPSSEADTD
jgi:uncharacterized protein with HEPN domain